MLKRSSKKGFTLIELLVVISILAILVAIGLVSYSNATKKGRDSRRKSDMKATQNAFEEYFTSNGQYATAAAGCANMDVNLTSGWPLPDPKPGYSYTCTSNTTTYCACALMEDITAGNSGAACAAGATTYYCVSQLQ